MTHGSTIDFPVSTNERHRDNTIYSLVWLTEIERDGEKEKTYNKIAKY